MYKYEWDAETGGYILVTNVAGVTKELRPVFHEELDLLGFKNLGWVYPESEKPLMWAEARRYIYRGELVAEAIGGSLYTKPEIKTFKTLMDIQPVNIEKMVERNRPFMTGLVHNTVETIYKTYNKYKNKVDVIYVAFSGGKDSLVLLDLAQKTLPHNEFKVIFSDTSMEISDTYKTINKVRELYPDLDIQTAKSHLDAKESWRIFGPPSRTLRWCCAVHKSAPSLLLLRNIFSKVDLKALVYDGVRAEESNIRAIYLSDGDNSKHASQINEHPLANWNSAEIFLYSFANNLLLNNVYRYGNSRVGCLICPLSSDWREFICNSVYPDEVKTFIEIISDSFKNKIPSSKERVKFIEDGGWKSRIDGRDFVEEENKVIEQEDQDTCSLIVIEKLADWKEWLKPIGELIQVSDNGYVIEYKKNRYMFNAEIKEKQLSISIKKQAKTPEYVHFMYLFKNALYKTAYCERCGVCEVECKFGALRFHNGRVIVTRKCGHCESCLNMPKGCLVAKSQMYFTGGKNVMIKGLGNYRGFGFDKEWLDYYFELGDALWTTDRLGKPKYDTLKIWLRESEITEGNILTELGKELKKLGADKVECWGIIAINLAYNSSLFKWYLKNVPMQVSQVATSLKTLLGDEYKPSTRDNAVDTLIKLFKNTPMGNDLGIGVCKINGKTVENITRMPWSNPNPLVILYSLYKFAEKCDGYYSFTLSYLCDDSIERNGISPSTIFSIDKDTLKEKIQNLATDYKEFISATFNKDLDNIDLNKEKISLDVLKLFN